MIDLTRMIDLSNFNPWLFQLLLFLGIGVVLVLVTAYNRKCRRDETRFRSTGESSRCSCGKSLSPNQTICIDCYTKHLRAKRRSQ